MLSAKNLTRRRFLQHVSGAAAGAGLCASGCFTLADEVKKSVPPARKITHGPKHHWFGYYDKLECSSDNRCVLGMEVDFEHREPRLEDTIRVGMVDLADGDRWLPLDTSGGWCWQQGCMLQWRPQSPNEIIWNDRDDDHYISHILDVKSQAKRTIEYPVYCVSPDGLSAVAPDFRRLAETRPGYGYVGFPDPNSDVPAPADSGIFHVDLTTGKQQLFLSLADLAMIPSPMADLSKAKHWVNHLLYNQDGSRLTFLHRWSDPKTKAWWTRMLTVNADGSDPRVVVDSGFYSHFIWRDPKHILAFAKATKDGQPGFFLFEDAPQGTVEHIAADYVLKDGHCTYSPDCRWILYDTYPDRQRNQHLYLYNIDRNERVELGEFRLAPEYRGQWRCDLHPRFSRDGHSIIFDSPHGGDGRQMYMIDVSSIT